jgi:hypothetical protein
MNRTAIVIVAALVVASTPKDKVFWEARPYDTWSKKECEKILTDSPWSARHVIGEYGVNTARFGTDGGLGRGTQADPDVLAGGERNIELRFYFSILSARPVRMALTRLSALENPGAIDSAAMKRQAEAPIPAVILVRIDYTVEPKGHPAIRDFELFFQQASLDFFSNTTYLASGRTRVPVAQYLKPGPQSPRPVFVFPRMSQSGQPFFTGQDESLFVETQIDLRKLGGQRTYEMHLKYDISKMRFAGGPEF